MSRSYVPRAYSASSLSSAKPGDRIYVCGVWETVPEPKQVADLATSVAEKLAAPKPKRRNYYRRGTSRLYGMSDAGNA